MIKKIIIITALTGLCFFSCSKPANEPTTQELLLGRWKLSTIVVEDVTVVPPTYTYSGTVDDYEDFRTDSKLYSRIDAVLDTSSYSVLSAQYILIGVDTFEIKVLNSNNLQLYHNLPGSTEKYTETLYK